MFKGFVSLICIALLGIPPVSAQPEVAPSVLLDSADAAFSQRDYSAISRYHDQFHALSLHDTLLQARYYLQKGKINLELSKPVDAMSYYDSSATFYASQGDISGHANATRGLATVYDSRDHHDLAMKLYRAAFKDFQTLGEFRSMGRLYYNMAGIQSYEGDFEKAMAFYDSAGILYQKANAIDDLPQLYSVMALVCIQYSKLDQAKEYLERSESLAEELNSEIAQITNQMYYTYYYNSLGQYEKALVTGEDAYYRALAKQDPFFMRVSMTYLLEAYRGSGDYKKAMDFQADYYEFMDSIYQQESEKKIAELSITYETELKEQENQILKLQTQHDQSTIKYQKIAVIILGVIVVGFILLIALLYLSRKRLNKAHKQITEQKQELQTINQYKSEFFANISHELRTPLTLIQGNVDLIEKKALGPAETGKKLSGIRRNAGLLKMMIDDLLDLSKLELKRQVHKPEPTSVVKYMERALALFSSLAEEKQINLSFDSSLSVEASAALDARQFDKVIGNLVYNAFKFSEKGEAVQIVVREQSAHIKIEVKDNGPGIPEEDQEHIFDRFYRAKNHGNVEGSGLGLAIAKEIVEQHNGSISVQSTPGSGSTFTILLPRVEDVSVQEESELPHASAQDIINDKLQKWGQSRPKILLVEDNVEVQEYLKEILAENFEVESCSDGLQALQYLSGNQPHLIISDVMMPNMDGFEMLKKVKDDPLLRPIPFIILTAKGGQDNRLAGLRLGVDDYITKPFDQEELLIRACNLLENLNVRIKSVAENEQTSTLASSGSTEDMRFIEKLKVYIEERIDNANLSVPEIAREVAMSERQLYRKTSEVCGLTPNQLIMELRLQKALRLLLNGEINKLSHLALEVGIATPSYLSKQFFERFGKRPVDYIS